MVNRFKRILSIIAVMVSCVAMPSAALAHDASYGFSHWYPEKNHLRVSLSIDQKSIAELGPIDQNKDESLSVEEVNQGFDAYILPYLKDKLLIHSQGKALELQKQQILVPDYNIVQFDLLYPAASATLGTFSIEYNLFFEKSNNKHKNIATMYVSEKQPVEHIFAQDSRTWSGEAVTPSLWSTLSQFIVLGVEHILIGYDHILFLLALVAIGLSFAQVVKVITAFTVAHSITLIMAALGVISLNSVFVESVIALSICYVAIENILKREVPYRWIVAFGFGLIHGFGFANVLQEIGIPETNMIAALLSFNIGVELGQILLFLIMYPVLVFLQKRISFRTVTTGLSSAVFVMGLIWFIERVGNVTILGL